MRTTCLLALLWLSVGACSGSSPAKDCRLRVSGPAGVVTLGAPCPSAALALAPAVQLDGTWVAASACQLGATPSVLSCAAGDAGTLVVTVDGEGVTLRLRATRAVNVGGFSLSGAASVPGATSWLSNGFQSWSQTGMVALAAKVSDADLASALAVRGDTEVVRSGNELSWWYTAVGGAASALVAGATSAERFRSWAQVSGSATALELRLASGGAGESVAVAAGASLDGEVWRIAVGDDATALLRAYGRALPSRRTTVVRRAEVGWNSWYELWDTIDETAVRAIAGLAATKLAPLVAPGARPRFVLDDGWQRAWGVWEPNAKFPSGLDGVARDVRALGFDLGVWLAPLLVHENSELARAHPDWLVAGAEYPHLKNGRMKVLDVTHPDAAASLTATIRRIVSWGYTLLKIDFLFAGTFEGRRHEAVTGLQAYRRALELIRAAAGEETLLVAVGAPPIPSFPFVDAWRLGPDIAVEPVGPSWYFVVDQARSVAGRWPLCLATLCDADPPLQRTLGQAEVEAGGWVVALAGGGLFFSDDLRKLAAERAGWGVDAYRTRLALGGEPAVPLDLFPGSPPATLSSAIADEVLQRNQHVVPLRWQLSDGARIFLNFTEVPQTVGGNTVPPHGALRY